MEWAFLLVLSSVMSVSGTHSTVTIVQLQSSRRPGQIFWFNTHAFSLILWNCRPAFDPRGIMSRKTVRYTVALWSLHRVLWQRNDIVDCLAETDLEIYRFEFYRHRLVDHGLHHHRHAAIFIRFCVIKAGSHHCSKCIFDEVGVRARESPTLAPLTVSDNPFFASCPPKAGRSSDTKLSTSLFNLSSS